MEVNELNRSPQVDVHYIQNKLNEGYIHTEVAKGCDLVLVVGNTDVCKRATCDYLVGHAVREHLWNTRPVLDTAGDTKKNKSETVYAKTMFVEDVSLLSSKKSENDVCLVDCPDFLDNETVEERVVKLISTELTIRNCQQIKGVIILISIKDLLQTYLTELCVLVKTLVYIFKDPVEVVRYLVFAIAKSDMSMTENEERLAVSRALRSLNSRIEDPKFFHENSNLFLSKGVSRFDFERIATLISSIAEREIPIILINPLDDGESRKLVFEHINGMRPVTTTKVAEAVDLSLNHDKQFYPITISHFNFSDYNENRYVFNQAIYASAHDGHVLMSKICEYADKCTYLYSEVLIYRQRIYSFKQLQFHYCDEMHLAEATASQRPSSYFKEDPATYVVDNDDRILAIEEEINQIDVQKEMLNRELKGLNTDNPIVFMQKSIHKQGSCKEIAFSWEEMEFSAITGSSFIPIIKVEKELKNGIWRCEDDRRKEGIYEITYESYLQARPASASVTAYIQTKDETGNKIRIEEINCEISKLNTKQEVLKSRISDLSSMNMTFLTATDMEETNKNLYVDNLRQKLKESQEDIDHITSMIEKMRKEREAAIIAGLKALQEFDKRRSIFDLLVSIDALLEFPSSLIKSFISKYTGFLSDLCTHRSTFNTCNVVCSSEEREVEPISSSPEGLLEQESLLLEKIDINENALPITYEQENLIIEEIKCLK